MKVHAHCLRHTCATQLLNAGCPVTSIQKFLGHKKLNSTMIYARAYDQTVEADYFAAMNRVEQRLDLGEKKKPEERPLDDAARSQLLELADKLAAPELSLAARLEIAGAMRGLLNDSKEREAKEVAQTEELPSWIPPPQFAPRVSTFVN